MDTWNRLTAVGGGRGCWIKEGEGSSQRTYMHNPQTANSAVRARGERGEEAGGGGQRGGKWGHL